MASRDPGLDDFVDFLASLAGVYDAPPPDGDPVDLLEHGPQCADLLRGERPDDLGLQLAGLVPRARRSRRRRWRPPHPGEIEQWMGASKREAIQALLIGSGVDADDALVDSAVAGFRTRLGAAFGRDDGVVDVGVHRRRTDRPRPRT